MKRFLFLILSITVLLLYSCEKPRLSEESINPVSEGVTESTYNHIDLYKPDFESDWPNTYKNVTEEKLGNYIKALILNGFDIIYSETKSNQNIYLLKKNNTYITLKRDEKNTLNFKYIEGITETRMNTKNCAEAKAIIGKEDINIIEIYIPDLYEKMNTQLFYVIRENNLFDYYNYPTKYLIIGNKAYSFSENPSYASYYESDNLPISYSYQPNEYIVCDIDNDLNYELLFTTFGCTSGVRSDRLISCTITDGKIVSKLSESIFRSSHQSENIIFEKGTDSEVFTYLESYVNDSSDFTRNKYKIQIFENSFAFEQADD